MARSSAWPWSPGWTERRLRRSFVGPHIARRLRSPSTAKLSQLIVRHSEAARSAEPGIHNPLRPRWPITSISLQAKSTAHFNLGVTNDIVRRGYEHRTRAADGFTARYGINKLVWFEIYDDIATAIAREKELKKWRRDWKIRLIEEQNPGWVDLYPGISN